MSKIYVMGSLNMDLMIETDIFPQEGETINGTKFETNPGGKGANQAVAAAKQNKNVIMLGAVGDDFFGKELIESLKENNVNTKYITTKEGSSGIAVIILNNGQNRIILDSGANYKYAYNDYKNILKENAKAGDYFVTQLETRLSNVEHGLCLAKSLGMKTILNPAPAQKLTDKIYKSTDIIIVNESEAQILTDIEPTSDYNLLQIMEKLLSFGVKNVIITLGKNGSCYYDNGVKHINPIDVEVVDTTAAGDTYIGALAVKLSEGDTLKNAINYATLCSSLTITRYGAQQSIPTLNEVENFKKAIKG